jgi:hypothetical protein
MFLSSTNSKPSSSTPAPTEALLATQKTLEQESAQLKAQIAALQAQLSQNEQQSRKVADQLDTLLNPEDPELAQLLFTKLPNLNRGIKCYVDSSKQQINIYLISCEQSATREVNAFFCNFLNDNDFLVQFNYGGIDRIVSFNQPVVTVQMELTDRQKLVDGLKLAVAAPQISSTTMTMRC